MTINIAETYSPFVLGRYETDSDFNGTDFRQKHLLPAILELVKDKSATLTVNLKGTFGCDPSFLEEAFGGMIRELRAKNIDFDPYIKNRLIIEASNKSEYLAITTYIDDAINASRN